MITFKKFGKTVKIRNDDWRRLRERFNPKNAVYDGSEGRYKIRRKCSLCSRYDKCDGCPLDQFGDDGCIFFFAKIFRDGINFEHGNVTRIAWDKEDDKKAKKQLNRLQRMMDKIEASQGEEDVTK